MLPEMTIRDYLAFFGVIISFQLALLWRQEHLHPVEL